VKFCGGEADVACDNAGTTSGVQMGLNYSYQTRDELIKGIEESCELPTLQNPRSLGFKLRQHSHNFDS